MKSVFIRNGGDIINASREFGIPFGIAADYPKHTIMFVSDEKKS